MPYNEHDLRSHLQTYALMKWKTTRQWQLFYCGSKQLIDMRTIHVYGKRISVFCLAFENITSQDSLVRFDWFESGNRERRTKAAQFIEAPHIVKLCTFNQLCDHHINDPSNAHTTSTIPMIRMKEDEFVPIWISVPIWYFNRRCDVISPIETHFFAWIF